MKQQEHTVTKHVLPAAQVTKVLMSQSLSQSHAWSSIKTKSNNIGNTFAKVGTTNCTFPAKSSWRAGRRRATFSLHIHVTAQALQLIQAEQWGGAVQVLVCCFYGHSCKQISYESGSITHKENGCFTPSITFLGFTQTEHQFKNIESSNSRVHLVTRMQ